MPQYAIDVEVNAEDNASANLGKISGGVDKMGLAFGGLATVAAGALIGVGVQAFNLAGEVEHASSRMEGALGLSTDEAVQYEETMRSIFRNNFGESYLDIAESIEATHLQLQRFSGDVPQAEMQRMTETALNLRSAFDTGVNESVGAAVTLMEEFGLTSDEAFGLITFGMQSGLDTSGDFLDSIGEYSNQFSEGGATAEEFFSILQSGMQGGVLGTDKAADAFKEFGIRIKDDSDATREALTNIGIDYEMLTQGFADGSITTIDAMQLVIEKLMAIEDPIARNAAGVALFGTQWEDMGETAVLAMDSTQVALEDTGGSVESLGAQVDNAAGEWAGASKLWQDSLVDVGKEMRLLGVEVIPWLVDQMQNRLIPLIGEVTNFAQEMRGGTGGIFGTEFAQGQKAEIGQFFSGEQGLGETIGNLDANFAQREADRQERGQAAINVNVNMQSGNAADAREGAQAGVEEAIWQRGGEY